MSGEDDPREPFFFPGDSPRGALLIHGLTGSPHEMRTLGRALQHRGLSALGVRLPGHGGPTDSRAHAGWPQWLAAVEQGLSRLDRVCSTIHLAGFSMGGLLALLTAHRHRQRITSIALMSTPLWLPLHARVPLGLIKLAGLDQSLSWLATNAPGLERWLVQSAWPSSPVASAFLLNASLSLQELMVRARAVAPRVKAPALILHSRRDPVAPYACSSLLLRRLPRARRVTLTRSAHVITLDVEQDLVAAQVGDFFEHAGR